MGQRQHPYQKDKLCLLSGLWPQGLFTQPSHGGLQLLKPSRVVPNIQDLEYFLLEVPLDARQARKSYQYVGKYNYVYCNLHDLATHVFRPLEECTA